MRVVNTEEWTNKIKEKFDGKKYFIYTLGCQLNENDSEKIAGMLSAAGISKTDKEADADIIIFNTCCVRENAEDRLYGKLGEVKKYKEDKGTIICVGGCMMQQEHVSEKIRKSYPYVDVVFGIHTLDNFAKDLYLAVEEKRKIEDIIDVDGEVFEGIPTKRDDSIKASVLIMNGCNNFCTYCIVPYVRGRERSRRPEDIIAEVKALAKAEYKEITLLGQNVNAYGKDINSSLAKLLKKVDSIGIERIKFMTSHPWDFTDELIEVLGSSKNIMPFLHLPVQSGSNEVLKKMGRRYTKESYLELVNKIKAKVPGIALTTDIIVGFPTETEEDFNETLDLVDKVEYSGAYTFIYSPRENTVAAKFESTVNEKEAKRRLYLLNDKINYYSLKDNKKYQDKIVKVLVTSLGKEKGVYQGYTEHNKVINVSSEENIIGQIVDVKVTDVKTWSINGIKI